MKDWACGCRSIRRCRRFADRSGRASSTSATTWKPSSCATALSGATARAGSADAHIQFGGELARYRVDIVNEFRRAGHFMFTGDVTGSAMADYFLGRIGTFDHGTGEYKNNRVTYSALFVQDDCKVHRGSR